MFSPHPPPRDGPVMFQTTAETDWEDNFAVDDLNCHHIFKLFLFNTGNLLKYRFFSLNREVWNTEILKS